MKSEVSQPVMVGIIAVVIVVVVAIGWIIMNREPKPVGTDAPTPPTAAGLSSRTGADSGASKGGSTGGAMARPGVD